MFAQLLLALSFLFALLDWLAVYRGWRRTEIVAKPAVMIALFGYLAVAGGPGLWKPALPLFWFGLGILFSLAGDVFLLSVERFFLPGLAAFLLAHICYIVGFNLPVPGVSLYALGLAVVYALMAARIYRRIAAGLLARGRANLRGPVLAYSLVITVMLLSATLTLFRPEWNTPAAGLAFLGAALFFLSDVILAWNLFVTLIRNGRVMNLIAYHLGQIALIAGVLLQFGPR